VRSNAAFWTDESELADFTLDGASRAPIAARSPSGGGGGGSGSGGGASGGPGDEMSEGLLSEKELKQIERDYADGMTSVQIVEVFKNRRLRFSEATLRKYVQQGMLPRSRRVGRKGKHQGSLGLYPPTAVRRINTIKRLMAENHTIEDIQKQFLRYQDEIEALERGLGAVFTGFEEELAAPHFDAQMKKGLKREIAEARKTADELLLVIGDLARRMVAPRDVTPGSRTPGGGEDLLR
jgi:hypothetical protein